MNRYAWQLSLLLVMLAAIGTVKNLVKAGNHRGMARVAVSGAGGVLGLPAAQTACLQNPGGNDWLTFDTGSGVYTFTGCNPGEFTLSGTGTVKTVNGVVFLTDLKPDRKVTASFNLGTLTGHATVSMITSPGMSQTLSINSALGQPCVCHP
jgi:hypothetical protein